MSLEETKGGNSLEIQWLGLGAFTAMGPGLIPGWGTKIPQALLVAGSTKEWGVGPIP